MKPVGSVSKHPYGGMLGAVPASLLAHAMLAVAALLWALHETVPPRPVTPDVAAQVQLVRGTGADHNGGAPEASPSPPEPKKPEEARPPQPKVERPQPPAPPVQTEQPPAAELPAPPPVKAPDLVLPAPQPPPPAPAPPPPVPTPPPPPAPSAQPAPAAIQAPPSTEAPPSVRLGDGIVGTISTSESPLAFVQADGDPDNVAPEYPLEAARRHEMGQVLLALHVDITGHVEQVDIVHSSGSSRLDEAARKTLAGWRFRPAFRNGTAVASVVQQNINFDP